MGASCSAPIHLLSPIREASNGKGWSVSRCKMLHAAPFGSLVASQEGGDSDCARHGSSWIPRVPSTCGGIFLRRRGSSLDAREHQGKIPCAGGKCPHKQVKSVGSSPTHSLQNYFLELREWLFPPSGILGNNPVTQPMGRLYL